MQIIGVDLHTRQQTVAMLNVETGEVVEKTLRHEGDSVREFYSTLARPKNSSWSARTEEMSGGQHGNDELNGPSRSGERETERSRNRDSNQPCAAAQTRGCAQEKQKLRRNVLDGADFVTDVLDS
jgi:hypothetical protein